MTGYREVNRMAVANLAIVFGPTLVSSTNIIRQECWYLSENQLWCKAQLSLHINLKTLFPQMWPPAHLTTTNMALNMMQQNMIVESLITNLASITWSGSLPKWSATWLLSTDQKPCQPYLIRHTLLPSPESMEWSELLPHSPEWLVITDHQTSLEPLHHVNKNRRCSFVFVIISWLLCSIFNCTA